MSNKYYTSAIGLEQYLNEVTSLLNQPKTTTYPPYNLIQVGNGYRVELAVAGFAKDDINIETASGYLTISGEAIARNAVEGDVETDTTESYLHRGISKKDFKYSFKLVQYLEVKSVTLKDGLLTVNLEQELPETLKPKKIEIK
jgi:molecular chaperone IbpA